MLAVLVARCSGLPFVLGLLLAPSVPARLTAQNTKLNGPLVMAGNSGSVSDHSFAGGGTLVVYRADREVRGRYELFSRPLDGSSPSLKLNGAMQPNGDVGIPGNLPGSFKLGAGDRVVYIADETVENVSELFSVPADGSAPRVRISQAGLNVHPFQLDPAGDRVVYQNGGFVSGLGPLFVVPVDGSSAPLTLTPGLDVRRFWLSPDGATTLFSANDPGPADEALYAMPTDGSAAPLLLARTHPETSGFGFMSFRDAVFAPDGRVVYNELEDADGDLYYTLYSVPLDASQPESFLNNHPFFFGVFALDPTALPVRVVFRSGAGVTTSIASDGTQPVVLSPPGWSGSQLAAIPLGSEVLFSAYLPGTGYSLFRGPSDGSSPAQQLLPPLWNIVSFTLASPTLVAVIRSVSGGNARQLGVVPLAGGTPHALHPIPPAGQGPNKVLPHPDGQRLLYIGDNASAGMFQLYVVPVDGSSPPLRLNGNLPSNEDVHTMAATPDLAHVTFQAGVGNGGQIDLFLRPLDASAGANQLNEFVFGGSTLADVAGFRATPDGARLVYRADQALNEEFDLYAVDLATPGTWLPLTAGVASTLPELALSPLNDRVLFVSQGFQLRAASLVSGVAVQLDSSSLGFATPFEYSADGTRAVYRRIVSGSDTELRSVAVDGLSPPVVLHAPLPTGRTVSQFALSSSGAVVFLSDLDQDEVLELFAVPIGGGTPVRLSRTPVAGGDVNDFRIDPSGTRVVYLADALVDGRVELFSTRLDASGLPLRLSGFMPTLGDVTHFAITPDGAQVVYRADQASEARFDLFSVPIDGPRPPVGRPGIERRYGATLLTGLTQTRSVQADWALTPDGAQVVYRANAGVATDYELYRVPVDGSTAPVRLSAPLVVGGDVLSFAIAPDSIAPGQGHVVYQADQRTDEVDELFSVPLAGGAAVALDLMPAFGDVSAYRIAPDSADVVFSADRDVDGVVELYRVPIDGSLAPVKVNPPLVSGGDVQTDFLALAGKTVYRADQERNDTFELYLDE